MQMSLIELGFVSRDSVINVECFQDHNWNEWDGGKVGGKPNWLHPLSIPSKTQLLCDSCKKPRTFILQIYCPLDTEIDAFHRCLYVFCCRQRTCNGKSRFRAFRSQLPRDNPFYAFDSTTTKPFQPHPLTTTCCVLCNISADVLTACQECGFQAHYCSELHRDAHFYGKCHPNNCFRRRESIDHTDHLFPHFDIFIDSEPDPNTASTAQERQLLETYRENREKCEDADDPFNNDSDIDITQSELKRLLGNESPEDPQYIRFLTRIAMAKSQILRYARWNNDDILWVHSKGKCVESVPSCPNCGAQRKFEFQILPQLLFFLKIDLEWGTLAIFTCEKSCQSSICAEEFVFFQPPYSPQTHSQ